MSKCSDKDVDLAILNAVSNVACETGSVPEETIVKIKRQLLGNTGMSDGSFISSLYSMVTSKEVEEVKEKSYGKKK